MAERYIPEHRRTQFKARNQFRPEELRRRREEQQVEIRKQKREENLSKRRGIQTRDGGIGVGGGVAATESDDEASAIESEVCAIFPYSGDLVLFPVSYCPSFPRESASCLPYPLQRTFSPPSCFFFPCISQFVRVMKARDHPGDPSCRANMFTRIDWLMICFVAQCGTSGDGQGCFLQPD